MRPMGRPLKLSPRYDKAEGKWVLNLPARLSPTGRRKRLFWDCGEEEKAKEHAKRLRERRDQSEDGRNLPRLRSYREPTTVANLMVTRFQPRSDDHCGNLKACCLSFPPGPKSHAVSIMPE